MTYTFRPAVRSSAIPLIGVFGESGTGKTMSALLLARGFVGPKGKICMIDTEGGRGALYADVIPGGYDRADLTAPFTPDSYVEAIGDAEKAGADIIVIDSGSHEWEGDGGVLSQAGEIEEKTGKPGLHCWNKPKAAHKKFMLKLLGAKVPVIICLRAKHKSRQVRGQNGKSQIIKDEYSTPIQADDFIFEMLAHFETLKSKLETGKDHHYIRLTKCSHPALAPCFPDDGPITIATGEAVRAWADQGEAPAKRKKANGKATTSPAGESQSNPHGPPDASPPEATPAGGASDLPTLEDAKMEALSGEKHLRDWYKGLSQKGKKAIYDDLESLMQTARKADAEKARAGSDQTFGDG